MAAFASVQDVVVRWRPLTSEETVIASTLLEDASDMVRVRFPTIDADLASGVIAQATIVRIVANMVKRAMINRDVEGVTQGSETVGPFTHSNSYANPNGNLYMSKDDILALDPSGYSATVVQAWLA